MFTVKLYTNSQAKKKKKDIYITVRTTPTPNHRQKLVCQCMF